MSTSTLDDIETGARFRVQLENERGFLAQWLKTQGLPFDVRRSMERRQRELDAFLAEYPRAS